MGWRGEALIHFAEWGAWINSIVFAGLFSLSRLHLRLSPSLLEVSPAERRSSRSAAMSELRHEQIRVGEKEVAGPRQHCDWSETCRGDTG